MKRLVIRVKEIVGHCPVYKIGDKIILNEGYKIDLARTDAVCMHSLASIMPYYNALFRGIDPRSLGLSRDKDKAYVQCLDPCKYTGGGTVIFEITREETVEVECSSGYKYAEKPQKVSLEGKKYAVKEIQKQWKEPEKNFFEIKLENDETCTISYSEKEDLWRKEK